MVDTSLHIDGWSCEQAYSGQKRHKNFVTKDVELNDEVEIERNSRFGIIFKRLDKMILLKNCDTNINLVNCKLLLCFHF